MELIKELNLNKDPQSVKNNSLICAKNIKISEDGKYITNDDAIERLFVFDEGSTKIVGVISCNTELVIFTYADDTDKSEIFIYYESLKTLTAVKSDWKWSHGEVFGTYTKNVKDEIIVAVSERNATVKVPLKIINVSIDTKTSDETKYTLAPNIPDIFLELEEYVEGNFIPNGVYNFYIRYYIDDYNKTNWYPCSHPVLAYNGEYKDVLNFTRPSIAYYEDSVVKMWSDLRLSNYSGKSTVSKSYDNNRNFKFKIFNYNAISYDKFEIGFTISKKDSIKAYSWQSFKSNIQTLVFDGSGIIEEDIDFMKQSAFNLYDVRAMDNYGNRLYVADYNESLENTIDPTIVDNIELSIIEGTSIEIGTTTRTVLKSESKYSNYSSWNLTEMRKVSFLFPNQNIKVCKPFNEWRTESSNGKYKYEYNYPCTVFHANGSTNTILGEVYIYKDDYNNGDEKCKYMFPIAIGSYTTSYKDVTFISLSSGLMTSYDSDKFRFRQIRETVIETSSKLNLDTQVLNKTLIPGEVYNFFIHFTRIDGSITKGYNIKPSNLYKALPGLQVSSTANVNICAPYDSTLNNVFAGIEKLCKEYDVDIKTIPIYKDFIDYFAKYGDYKIYRIFADVPFITGTYLDINKYYQTDDTFYVRLTNYGYSIYSNLYDDKMFVILGKSIKDNIKTLVPKFSNITVPSGYNGYILSYEKLESKVKVRGIATLSDYIGRDLSGDFIGTLRLNSNDLFKTDLTNISSTLLQVVGSVSYSSGWNTLSGYNRSILNLKDKSTYIPIEDIEIASPNNVASNNVGREAAILINKGSKFTKSDYGFTSDIHEFILCNILDTSETLYSKRVKTLIPMTKIIYNKGEIGSYNTYISTNKDNLGGYVSIDNIITYNKRGVTINNVAVLSPSDGSFETYGIYYKTINKVDTHTYVLEQPFAIVQIPIYDTILHELIEDKNVDYAFNSYIETWKEKGDQSGYELASVTSYNQKLPTPDQLFKSFEITNNFDTSESIKKYDNYTGIEVIINRYKRWIRRSDIQQSESSVIAWRSFSPNNYKQITENKGDIKNIVGVGSYLLVHTEHSLFMFNRDASLKTQNKDVQLIIPDAFDVEYQEVFTADKGYGGLQNYVSWCVNEYGYTFFDNSNNRLYNFDNGSLNIISLDIVQFLKSLNIDTVVIANDVTNNRFIMAIQSIGTGYVIYNTISYNYLTKSWISLHDYTFRSAYNTKEHVYLLPRYNNTLCTFNTNPNGIIGLYTDLEIEWDDIFPEYMDDNRMCSYIDIIFNDSYEISKALVYIDYILSKVSSSYTGRNVADKSETDYSGYQLLIYTDSTTTDLIDINVENSKNKFNNYKYPYLNKGVWSFNYFRNYNEVVKSDNMSLIYGKYIVARFIFDTKDNKRIKFENINFNVKQY